jgi:hypothetical protein
MPSWTTRGDRSHIEYLVKTIKAVAGCFQHFPIERSAVKLKPLPKFRHKVFHPFDLPPRALISQDSNTACSLQAPCLQQVFEILGEQFFLRLFHAGPSALGEAAFP